MEKNLIAIMLLIGLFACRETPLQHPDNDFDVSVSKPTFTSPKPVILFDEGHNNFHTTTGLYEPFANLMKNDGYDVKTLGNPVTKGVLAGATIFMIANAKGKSDLND